MSLSSQPNVDAPEAHFLPARTNLGTVSSQFESCPAPWTSVGQLQCQIYQPQIEGLRYETPPAAVQYAAGYRHPFPPLNFTPHPVLWPQAVQPPPVPIASDLHVLHSIHPYSGVLSQDPAPSWLSLESSHANALHSFSTYDELRTQNPDEASLSVSIQTTKEAGELVCFGTLPEISARCGRPGSGEIPPPLQVQIESSDRFSAKDFPEVRGRIPTTHGQMIQGLLDEKSLRLHGLCTFQTEPAGQRPSRGYTQIPCMLEVTVYGPLELFDEIGSWFEEYDIFLQDPQVCYLDVKYCNPQRLSSDDLASCPLVSEVVARKSGLVHLQVITERPDLLDILDSNVDLEEAPQPPMIRTALKRHQRQALTFMLRREIGWAFDCKQSNIWEAIDTDEGQFFLNRVSNTDQTEEPPQFYGGIIADPMGLGKTLTMIALVVTDLESVKNSTVHMSVDEDHKHDAAATLIIVPPPLLGTWEEQLAEHVYDGGLKCRRHHGKFRLTEIEEVDPLNVVLTTYHTVSAEWKVGKAANKSPLFSIRWRRVILDEAHFVRNGNSQTAHAVCALSAVSRWAVTGTPIQNRLSDLATLLKFIRVYPYDDPKCFDADISRLWKSGQDEEAVKRIKRLSACLLLRRAKGTIRLPPRRDLQCPVEFTRAERAMYDEILHQAVTRIDEALHQDSELTRSGVYVNVLQQIESLRLFCNLGLHYHTRHDKPMVQSSPEACDWGNVAQHTFNARREMGPIVCLQCSSAVDLTETLLDDLTTMQSPQFSRCMKLTCSECSYKLSRAAWPMECGHNPPCPTAPVSLSSAAFEGASGEVASPMLAQSIGLPSKVEALVADIKTLPPDVKWCVSLSQPAIARLQLTPRSVVFSTWRLTLDIVEAGLNQAGVTSIRFDGKVPQKERQVVVNRFRTDPDVRIMLLTLSCGAAGLTLTVASRAYLMEPHWNPSLEEQALARIHRLGQTREITTIRFFVRNSFEEQVMRVQESKKHLACVLLSPHDGGQTDDSLGGLQMLRSLL
ncbi:SNF2 family N-terminal domain-containing protein [Thelonectria olida]|uniref:SNF2 family N-terminal domain-containing protein n=1 Tax=Thelonectria olida TaxID=1576542 RepID=A0A9P9AGC4_9HYPO|nr:SNF2 family N-terminal domain-containing protein [Thelonectria olida]